LIAMRRTALARTVIISNSTAIANEGGIIDVIALPPVSRTARLPHRHTIAASSNDSIASSSKTTNDDAN